MNVGAITGDIVLNANPALKAEKQVAEGARQMKAGVENENAQAARSVESQWKQTLGNLKGDFGKSSTLGQTMKLLAGGGAIMGISMVGSQLNAATKTMEELVTAFRMGKATAGEFTEKLLGSLPVLGQFWEAGRNIREMLLGEAAAEEKYIQSIHAEVAANEKAAAMAKRYRSENESLLAIKERLSDAAILARDPSQAAAIAFRKTVEEMNKSAPAVGAWVAGHGGDFGAAKQSMADQIDAMRLKNAALAKDNAVLTTVKGTYKPREIGGDFVSYDTPASAREEVADPHAAVAQEMIDANTKAINDNNRKLLDLGNLFKELGTYGDALDAAIAQRDSPKNEMIVAMHEREARSWWDAQKAAMAMGPGVELAMPPEEARARMMERLPSPILHAEELYGPKTVTEGLPQYVDVERENTEVTKKNTSAMAATTAAVVNLAASLQAGPTAGGATLDGLAGG